MDGDREPVGIARLGQQPARRLGIERIRLQPRAGSEEPVRQQAGRGNRSALHHPLDDRGAVDRLGDRHAHAPVLEWIRGQRRARPVGRERGLLAELIHVQEQHGIGRSAQDGHARVGLQLRKVGRRHVVDRLHIAGKQGGDPRGLIGDHPQRDILPVRLRPPIGVIALQSDPVAREIPNEPERPGTDRGLAAVEVGGRRMFVAARDDFHRRQVVRQQRIRRGGTKADRIGIDDDRVGDRARVGDERVRTVRHPRHAAQRGGNVFSAELLSVMEPDTAAQRELPCGVVDRLPGAGEVGHRVLALVLIDQRLEHVHGNLDVGREIVEVRIERRHRGAEPERDVLRHRGRCCQQRGHDGQPQTRIQCHCGSPALQ